MNKQSLMLITFSAMLSLNAFAPQLVWENKHTVFRAPSSLEEDRLEALELKKIEEARAKDKAIADAKEAAAVQCKKDEAASLEEQMKKLIADKEKLLKELEELASLKKAKLNEVSSEIVADAPKKDSTSKKENPDLMMILSQVTSFMVTQQEQQAKMMNFFFSMMPYMQQQQRSSEPRAQYFSPYAFSDGERFGNTYALMPSTDYSLIGRQSHRIGLGTRFDNLSPYSNDENNQKDISGPGLRAPSQTNERAYNPYEMQRSMYPQVHDGYDFTGSQMTFKRVQF